MKIAPFVVAVFLASGCAALIYELAWFQSLAILLGGTTRGMALVLATFMAGMGLGAVLLPRRIGPSLHPLAACGLLEAFIAVSGAARARTPAGGLPDPVVGSVGRPRTLALLRRHPPRADDGDGGDAALAAPLFAGSGDANRRLGSLYAAAGPNSCLPAARSHSCPRSPMAAGPWGPGSPTARSPGPSCRRRRARSSPRTRPGRSSRSSRSCRGRPAPTSTG
jgi:hypothetical protein